jgi:galactose mutarotase-like enzyme
VVLLGNGLSYTNRNYLFVGILSNSSFKREKTAQLQRKDRQVKLVASFMNFPTSREKVLNDGDTTIGIIPEICLISHFQVGTWQMLYRPAETGNVKRWGLTVMVPNSSWLRNGIFQEKGTSLPVNGFGRILPWKIKEISESALSLQLDSSAFTRQSYPYEFTYTVSIEADNHTLTYILTMENHSEETMPIAPGFQCFFSIAQEQKSKLVTEGLEGFSAEDFNWIERIPDNFFPFSHDAKILVPGRGALAIKEILENEKYSLRNMRVWSEPPSRPDHDFVCFEVTVGREDSLNRPSDRLMIEPNNLHTIALQFRTEL